MRPKLYTTQLNETELWEKLAMLIDIHTQANLAEHLKKYNIHRRGKVYGKLEENQFQVWQHGLFSGSIFYPIFEGKIIKRGKKITLDMNSKPNSMGTIVFMGLTVLLVVFLWVWLLYMPGYRPFSNYFYNIPIALGIFLLFQAIPNITFTMSKRNFRMFLEDLLELERVN